MKAIMSHPSAGPSTFLLVFLASFMGLSFTAPAQEAIRNRAVRIIGNEATQTPAPTAPTGPTTAPAITDAEQRADNPYGVKLEILPGEEVLVGAEMAVRVSVEKSGYLVVVDVDSGGRLTQIYPNTQSLADKGGQLEKANFLTKGKSRLVPDPKEKSSFQFVAAEPKGVGMVVAILSDKPVQMIDLPDVPAALAGQKPAVEYVRENTRSLKILPASDNGVIVEPKWSFVTKFYVIK